MLNLAKFKDAKYLPLTREEMIDLIEGRWNGRVAVVNEGHWLHIDELDVSKKAILEQLVIDYPCDVQAFYVVKAPNFGQPGNRYCWCDVADADPVLHRDESIAIGVDEETAIEWEIINQISEGIPDPNTVNILANAPESDGRYRLFLLSTFYFNRMWYYRGLTNSLLDIYTDEENVLKLLRKMTSYYKTCIKIACENAEIDGITFCDDWGMQKGSFMSPAKFRELYMPFYQEVFDYVHSFDKHVWFHCCGDISALAELFIEAGVDVLHPIQKFANDEKEFLEKYGNRVCTWVGMDLQRILPYGSVQEVQQETKFIIDTFVKGNHNRVILTISNRLEDDVPINNFIAFIQQAYEYGEEVVKNGLGEHQSPCYSDRVKWYGTE